ncbi:MAG: hypothetical protein QNJ20_01045 [Paracoccaceae bacterium]|nr:hypothetical protein [Paracoccaceae bacterium]
MTAFYFLAKQFDPKAQARMRPRETYGGEYRLYVIAKTGFPDALGVLLDFAEDEGWILTEICDADHVSKFDPDADMPFTPDIKALTRDAIALRSKGGFVSHEPRTFEPQGITPMGFVCGLADTYDVRPAENLDTYEGELAEFVVKSDLHHALRTLCEAQSHEDFLLRGLLRVRDVAYAGLDSEAELSGRPLADAVRSMKQAPQGAIAWGACYEYGQDDD